MLLEEVMMGLCAVSIDGGAIGELRNLMLRCLGDRRGEDTWGFVMLLRGTWEVTRCY